MKKRNGEIVAKPSDIRQIPVVNIRVMTDDEWNRLAYQNYLERLLNRNKNHTIS